MEASAAAPLDKDPQTIVTERAFRVSQELLGANLARPWKRAAALSLDGVLVAILANAPGVIFGFAASLVLLRAVAKPAAGGGFLRRSVRRVSRFSAAVILFFVAVSLWGSLTELASSDPDPAPGDPVVLSGVPSFLAGAEALAVIRSTDEADARERFERLSAQLQEAGMPDEEIVEILSVVPETAPNRPWLRAAADSVLGGLSSAQAAEAIPEPGEEDQLITSYANALAENDSARAEILRPQLVAAVSRDTVAALEARLEARNDWLADLEAAIDEAEADDGGGIVETFRGLLDDLGLGFGWTGLYFTAFAVLWRGQTPGKRLFGIRIVRLDNVPLGWWAAFGRFGGYAAGLATGLIGFLQIFWDANRQAVHDKIAATVVIQD